MAFKQKADLSFNTSMAVQFLTNNIPSSIQKTRSQDKTKKLTIKILIWVSYKARLCIYLLFTRKSHLGREETFITREEREDGQSRTLLRLEKAKNRHTG